MPYGNRHAQHPSPKEQRKTHVRNQAQIRGQLPQAAIAHPLQEGPVRQPARSAHEKPAGALVAALNEPVFVTIDGERRKITKREAVITQLVNESAGANLRATKMLINIMKEVEKKTGAEPPPEPHRFALADEEVIKKCRGADTGSPAVRDPGHKRGQPGSRDDFFVSSQRPG
jgi:hypothetical protein